MLRWWGIQEGYGLFPWEILSLTVEEALKGSCSLVTVEGRGRVVWHWKGSCKARAGWGLMGWWARVGVRDGHLWSQHLDGGGNIVKSTLATPGDLVSGCVLVLESSRCGSLWSQIKWLKHNFNYSCPWFGICTNINLSFQCMHYNKIDFANQFALTFKKIHNGYLWYMESCRDGFKKFILNVS